MNNREILFRGKRTDGKGWAEGFYMESIHKAKKFFIVADLLSKEMVQVDPNTVGQFTGLLDKEGNKIFEGDIVSDEDGLSTVVFVYDGFRSYPDNGDCYLKIWGDETTVVGNVYENPELLNQQQW